jgi:hypothetical protein
MKITINDKEIELKYTLRSMLMYENITDKTFNPSTMSDVITFMYCIVVASSKDYTIKFDDFIDWLDDNPNIINEFGEWIQTVAQNNNVFKKN